MGVNITTFMQLWFIRTLHDHEEGHAERVNVEQSAEDYGDLQAAVLHPLHDYEEGHAERVNEEQFVEDYGDLHAAELHPL